MSEEKPDNQYDWGKLKAELKEKTPRLGTITDVVPDRDTPRVMSGVSDGINPLRYVVNTQLESLLHILKQRKQNDLDLEYCLRPFSFPLPPHNVKQMTPQDLSAKLGFDTETLIKLKNMKDYAALLNEAITEVNNLNKHLDEVNENFCREDFREGAHTFTQYMDKNDNAHIKWIDPEIKKNILDNNLVGVSPWVEIFKVDANYCIFTNKHGKVVGRLRMMHSTTMSHRSTWKFESEPIAGTTWELICKKPYPYDCEREVVQWMVKMNLFESFINHNPE